MKFFDLTGNWDLFIYLFIFKLGKCMKIETIFNVTTNFVHTVCHSFFKMYLISSLFLIVQMNIPQTISYEEFVIKTQVTGAGPSNETIDFNDPKPGTSKQTPTTTMSRQNKMKRNSEESMYVLIHIVGLL